MPDVFVEPHKKPEENLLADPVHKAPLNPITIMNRKAERPGLFTAFTPRPTGISFENQEPDEEIILLLRRHFATNLPWVFLSCFFLIIPFLLIPFFASGIIPELPLPGSYLFVLTAFYVLIILGFMLTQFATWYYQVGIITNYRIIDVDFNSLLAKNIAYTELEDIVDVESMQGGLMQNVFNYGTVQMQTEGLKPNFEFMNIPQPTAVADTVSDLMRGRRKHA
jgi:hypothetical protein